MTAQPPLEEYPIHPTLDRLIQHFKKFSNVEFPRGAPKPIEPWMDIIRGLTRYEASVASKAYDYLCGKEAVVTGMACPEELKNHMNAMKVPSDEESQFLNKLLAYRNQIEEIGFDIEDCVRELGNPCKQFRN